MRGFSTAKKLRDVGADFGKTRPLGFDAFPGLRNSAEQDAPGDAVQLAGLCLQSEWSSDAAARANALITTRAVDWDGFIRWSIKKSVAPQIWEAARQGIHLPVSVMQRLKSLYLSALARYLPRQRLEARVLKDFHSLAQEGIRPILLKGHGLAELLYVDPAIRSRADIDLIAPREAIPRITDFLLSRGYLLEEAPEEMQSNGLHKLSSHLLFTKGFPDDAPDDRDHMRVLVEVHSSLVGFHYRYFQDWDWLWENAVETRVIGVPVLVLNLECRFLNLCAHLVINHTLDDFLHIYELAKFISLYGEDLNWLKALRLARRHEYRLSVQEVMRELVRNWAVRLPAGYRRWALLFPPRTREKLFFNQPSLITALHQRISALNLQIVDELRSMEAGMTKRIARRVCLGWSAGPWPLRRLTENLECLSVKLTAILQSGEEQPD